MITCVAIELDDNSEDLFLYADNCKATTMTLYARVCAMIVVIAVMVCESQLK